MDTTDADRREAELALLEAMYPEAVSWAVKRAELTYRVDNALLTLRLPDDYPSKALPMVVSASIGEGIDCRDALTRSIAELSTPKGEECLDTTLQAFEEMSNNHSISSLDSHAGTVEKPEERSYRTCIIWLHHLLNTNKRKLAITPATGPASITGCTKPGYPGVLIYSGKSQLVKEHVAVLHDQRWQAFQIRHDESGLTPWAFASPGITEVGSMAEVVDNIKNLDQKETFLQAIGIR